MVVALGFLAEGCSKSTGGFVPPPDLEVGFSVATTTASESGSTSINVELTASPTTFVLSEPITTQILVTGTATDGTDYTLSTTTVTFPAGATHGTVVPVLVVKGVGDSQIEGDETVVLTLQDPGTSASLGAAASHTLTLRDDNTPSISFQASSGQTATEGTPLAAVVELTIPGGAVLPSLVTVDVVDLGTGSALSGADYAAFPAARITFPVGAATGATQSVTLAPVAGDNLVEGAETVLLRLQNPLGVGALGTALDHTITINDNDSASISFQAATGATANEVTALLVNAVLTTTPPTATLAVPVGVNAVDSGGGTATTGADYVALSQTLTFPAGAANGAIQSATLTPLADTLVEGAEVVALGLQSPSGPATLAGLTVHTATILDDDSATVAFSLASSSSADEATNLLVAAQLSIPAGATLAIPVTLDAVDAGGGSATSGTDYTAFAVQTLTFPVGSVTGATTSATLAPTNDADPELNETVNLQVQNVGGPATLGAQVTHVATLTNDDVASVAFSAATSSVAENAAAHTLTVQLTIAGGGTLRTPVTVDGMDATGGSALSGTDYTAIGTQGVTFPIGATTGATQTLTLTQTNDVNVEANETVNLLVQNVGGPAALGAQTTHTATINEDDVATVEFVTGASATVDESTALNVSVRLNIPSGGVLNVAVNADAVDAGTGLATTAVDYTAFGVQGVTFAVGSGNGATQNVTLTPIDDATSEGNETVNLLVQNVAGTPTASLGAQATHTATITDDEATLVFQLAASSTATESTALTVSVVLSSPIPLAAALSVDVADTAGGTATSGTDYTAFATQTLTFPLGSTNGAIRSVTFTPLNDAFVEGSETVNLRLQNVVGAGVLGAAPTTHAVTITDADTASIAFALAASASADEATALTLDVTLTVAGGGTLATAVTGDVVDAGGGTATTGVDFGAFGTQTVTFPIGAGNGATQQVTLNPLNDLSIEGNESVNLRLQNVGGQATLGAQTTHAATLTDDDTATIQFQAGASATADEATPLNVVAVLTTTPLGATLSAEVTVTVSDAASGTATSGTDYTAIPPTLLTFPLGSGGATRPVAVLATQDGLVEGDETVNLTMASLTGPASLGGLAAHAATITDDEAAGTVAFTAGTSSTTNEASGAPGLTVTLTLPAGTLGNQVTVTVSDTTGGTATSGADYTAIPPTLFTFPVGTATGATQSFTVPVIQEGLIESDETVNLAMTLPTGPAGLGALVAHTLTITDDHDPFDTEIVAAAGNGARAVAVGDFDGDGDPDLAVANFLSNNVSVLIGQGDGTFVAAASPAVGTSPRSVAVGDFDGDGDKDDLAVANSASNTVSILIGQGDGTFVAAVSPAVGTQPVCAAVGDFNGDGDEDLAVANANSNTVSILIGQGDGTFVAAAVSPAVGTSPQSVAVGDFDGDGDEDLAVANFVSNTVSILIGQGDGTFVAAAVSPAVGTQPLEVAVGDFDGDGDEDLAVANTNSNTVSILIGQGDGTFVAAASPAVGTSPQSVAVGDFNGDGDEDLAVANANSNTVSVLIGAGNGTFVAAASPGAGVFPIYVAVGDFDGDGDQDLAVANFSSNNVSVLVNRSVPTSGTFSAAASPAVGSRPSSVAVGDFDGDGDEDLAVANDSSNTVSILIGQGDGTFVAAAVSPAVGTQPLSVAVGDFNGDGNEDLAVANGDSDTVSILIGQGDGTFVAAAVSPAVGTKPVSVAVGDFNGDGNEDLAVVNRGSDTVSILIGQGDGTFVAAASPAVGTRPLSVAVGDFDGDGDADLAVANGISGTVSILIGQGDGIFVAAASPSAGVFPASVAVGDFDGDGDTDLAVANGTSSNVSILIGQGDGTFVAAASPGVGSGPQSVVVGDFDGDGDQDLAVANASSNTFSILIGQGDGTFVVAAGPGVGSGPQSVAVGDFDGDGDEDLAVANSTSNTVSILIGQP